MSLIPKVNIDINGKVTTGNNTNVNTGVKASIAISDDQGTGIFNNLTHQIGNTLQRLGVGDEHTPSQLAKPAEPDAPQHQSAPTLPKNDTGTKGNNNYDDHSTRYEDHGGRQNGNNKTNNDRDQGQNRGVDKSQGDDGQRHDTGRQDRYDAHLTNNQNPLQPPNTKTTDEQTVNTQTNDQQAADNQTANNQQPVNNPPVNNQPPVNQPVNNQTVNNSVVTNVNVPPETSGQSPHNYVNQPLIQTVSTTVNTVTTGVTGLVGNIVNQVLQQNDIYLSPNIQNILIQTEPDNRNMPPVSNNQINTQNSGLLLNDQSPNTSLPINNEHSFNNNQLSNNLPVELHTVVQTVDGQVRNLLNNLPLSGNSPNQSIKFDVPQNLQSQIQALKNVLFQDDSPVGKVFTNLNMHERMQTAVDIVFRQLPPSSGDSLRPFSNQEVLNGFLMARGLIVAGESSADVRNLVAFKNEILPANIAVTDIRDLGQLVKILIGNAAIAKTTANLELAVQKFVRILIANNELGVMLATVSLARESALNPALLSRTLALVQIYQLIGRLVIQGQLAMQEVAAKYGLDKSVSRDLSVGGLKILSETDPKNSPLDDLKTSTVYNNLRQFLEFNPAAAYNASASAFINPDDARQSRQDFMNHCQDDLSRWLGSGNHRFVKDFDLGKPLGIVIERLRGSEDYFTATKVRIVLVRDGSVQGWHFLKSFLVR